MQVQNQHLRTSIDGFPADLLKSLNMFLPSKITARYVQKYRFKSKAKKTNILQGFLGDILEHVIKFILSPLLYS